MDTTSLRIEQAKNFISKKKEWISYCKDLDIEISERKDMFAFGMSSLNQGKVHFEFLVMSSLLTENSNTEQSLPENEQTLEIILKNLEQVAVNYRRTNHIENLLAVLSTQYEIYVFMDNTEAREDVEEEMKKLIDFYELKESKSKFDFLMNGGTTSEQLELLFSTNLNGKKKTEEYNSLIKEMKAIDALEERRTPKNYTKDVIVVDLFPIQYFIIDKNRLKIFYKILNIDNAELIENLNFFFDNGIIPILNILIEVKTEGPLNGHLESKGVESWRRIRDIRLALYENKFYRK